MKAICVFTNTTNEQIRGCAIFKELSDDRGVKIHVRVSGLQPGLHGFHIHQCGDLRQGCNSMCQHFNPFNVEHGSPQQNYLHRHVGDLGNIYADQYGHVNQILYDDLIRLNGQSNLNIIGRGLIIHNQPDDLGLGGLDPLTQQIINPTIHQESLKTGNAGKRIACGIIGYMMM